MLANKQLLLTIQLTIIVGTTCFDDVIKYCHNSVSISVAIVGILYPSMKNIN